jgi:hypothetical protein
MLLHGGSIQLGAGQNGRHDDLPEEVGDGSADGLLQLGDLDGRLATQSAVEDVDGVVFFQHDQFLKDIPPHILGLLLAALLHDLVKNIDLLFGC